MTKPVPLSPAAQEVWGAVIQELDEAPWNLTFVAGPVAAAALRAVAEQVGPSEILPPGYAYSAPAEMWHYEFKLKAQRQILGIADELKGQQ